MKRLIQETVEYREGQKAAEKGMGIWNNPYMSYTVEHDKWELWNKGFDSKRRELNPHCGRCGGTEKVEELTNLNGCMKSVDDCCGGCSEMVDCPECIS